MYTPSRVRKRTFEMPVNRIPFKHRMTAAFHHLVELGRTSRARIEESTDNSKSTVQGWFNVETAGSIREDGRLPDAHDVHQLAVNLPDVAAPLLDLIVDQTEFRIGRGPRCDHRATLDDGTDALIESIKDVAGLLASWREKIADRVLTREEAASIEHDRRKLMVGLEGFGRLVAASVKS